jgi:xylulokinase
MTNEPAFAGIDVGTTGTRCIIFDASGSRLGHAYQAYPAEVLGPGWVEQSVPLMLDTTMTVCREAITRSGIDRTRIVSLGVSTQMCCTIACRADGSIVRPMISWQDVRAQAQTEAVAAHLDSATYSRRTGYPLSAQAPLMKILWLRDHEPEHFLETKRWLMLQQVVLHAFGAEGFFGDASEANFTGMWDVNAQRWDDDLLGLAGVSPHSLGSIVSAGTRVGEVSDAAADASGFAEGTALGVGAGDQISGVVGLDSSGTDVASVTLGTAGFLNRVVRQPRTDVPAVTVSNHVNPGEWLIGAVMLSAASSLDWFRNTLGEPEIGSASQRGTDPYDELTLLAAHAPPGCDGVLFLPFLNSAGAPHWNPDATAAFLGITAATTRAAMARAVLEGVAFEVRDNLRHMADHAVPEPTLIRATGGAMRSDLWAQILADITQLPVERSSEAEAACLGAAMLGAVGAGYFGSHDEAAQHLVHTSSTLTPDANTADVYDTHFGNYLGASQRLFPSTPP